jgi:hypothetical protein
MSRAMSWSLVRPIFSSGLGIEGGAAVVGPMRNRVMTREVRLRHLHLVPARKTAHVISPIPGGH